MDTKLFINLLKQELNCSLFTGVPDSQLKELCYYLTQNESKNHLFDFYSSGRNCYYCKCYICSALLLQKVTE